MPKKIKKPNDPSHLVRTAFLIDQKNHQRLRIAAILDGLTINDFIVHCVKKELKNRNLPTSLAI